MDNRDKAAFADLIKAAREYYGQPEPTNGFLRTVFEDLAEYPLSLVESAVKAHRKDPDRGRFAPKTADIEFQIKNLQEKLDGHIDPDSAWNVATKYFDERISVIVSPEIVSAAESCRELFFSDPIAARMSFKRDYLRLINEARANARPAAKTLSIGSEPAYRDVAIQEAERLGLHVPEHLQLSSQPADLKLLANNAAKITDESQREKVLAHLSKLKEILNKPKKEG